ncbi:hypothetical protein CXF81_01080 [Glaciecola sp. 33A]|jgi:hypothetical protein|nr:hypothetical protein CXF81_01080 [Glaciecola sp. 33A]
MNKYEYKIEKVLYSLASRGEERLKMECEVNGNLGWELVSTQYHWFTAQYILFFKRQKHD